MIESQAPIAWGISIGSMYWSAFGVSRESKETQLVKRCQNNSTPASVLLGWSSGEPLRLDCWKPSHPRGTASEWPKDAVVNCEKGSGRFPLAAAWTGRHYDFSWPWKPDSELRQLDSLEAICFGTAQLAKLHAHKAPVAIVIPNDFKQREQQRLLDACNAVGVNASLIWLPVAAALAWLEDNSDILPSTTQIKVDYPIAVIHADWGKINCTLLSFVAHQENPKSPNRKWMPARRRPNEKDSLLGFGWASIGRCTKANAHRIWRNLFASMEKQTCPTEISSSNVLQEIAKWTFGQSSPEAVDAQLESRLLTFPSPKAILFVGDFAREISQGPKVSRMLKNCLTFVADGPEGEELLARGASIFKQDCLKGHTSYLDTLPKIELFVDRNNKYEWMSILGNADPEDAEQFVAGGQKWELPDPIDGLSIRRGASSVKLIVAHDEFEGVRELQARLDHPAEQRLSAKLHVSATPAQGNARLELVTMTRTDAPAKVILAKWEQMAKVLDLEGKPVDKASFLKLQPRAYPELLPRRMSEGKWRSVLPMVQQLKDRMRIEVPSRLLKDERFFTDLKNQLLAKDQSQTPHDATAIGSDSKAPFAQDSLEELKLLLLKLWKSQKESLNPVVSTIIRALGYISVDDREFEDWLVDNLRNSFHDRQSVLHTSGLAMRAPCNILKLVEFVFFWKGKLATPGANELKAISQVLRYRIDATKEIESEKCKQVIRSCLITFEWGMESGGGGYPFRWASLIVVYLLRRRMFDLDFLDPESELALHAKQLFRTAIERYKARQLRPLGGSVDLPAALQQMINYIDRKGSGDILMAGE